MPGTGSAYVICYFATSGVLDSFSRNNFSPSDTAQVIAAVGSFVAASGMGVAAVLKALALLIRARADLVRARAGLPPPDDGRELDGTGI